MISFYFHLLLFHLNKGYKIEMCNVVLEAEQPSGSTYFLEANQATGSLFLKYGPLPFSFEFIISIFLVQRYIAIDKFYSGK